ncbi:MAG: type II secretion system F family protein [Lachnospiraceae bacterium]|nr:type II secretion system F family protein [Lachnospiraceae bacterium]
MKKAYRLESFLIPERKLRDALELYPGKTREEVRKLVFHELERSLLPGVVLAVLFLILAAFSAPKDTEVQGIIRPAPGSVSASVQVQLELPDGFKTIPLEISPLEYEEAHIEKLHPEAVEYLTAVVPGKNKSLQRVTTDLFFPEILPATGGKIHWTTDAPWLITSEGKVLNANLTEEVDVLITAKIFYGSEYRLFSGEVTVYPAEYTEEEALLKKIQTELMAQEKETRKTEQFILPEEVFGYRIEQRKTTNVSGSTFLVLLAVTLPAYLYSHYFGNLDTRRKKRKEQAEGGYTEFVTKLSLMLAAGISVRQAFMRLAEDYERNQGSEYVLTEELKVIKQELDNGGSERVVYEAFGRRIGVLAYRRMASLLTQNVSKGVQGMGNLLLQEAKEVMAQDRANIRQKGEQAGTKLLLPMMGLLILVFAILLVPAFQSF